jgi:uncharacterized membrane protein
MRSKKFGVLVAGAVAGMIGSSTFVRPAQAGDAEAKGCYRKHCGGSVKGHEGTCGGTKVEDIKDQKTCEEAGGAWSTEAEAGKLKH